MESAKITKILERYTEKPAAEKLALLIIEHHVSFKISSERSTKYGDYRFAQDGLGHRISVNGSLNKYAFLLTALHEFAHLIAFEKYGKKIAPHGREWKNTFGQLLIGACKDQLFPAGLREVVLLHARNPSASSDRDPNLRKALSLFNKNEEDALFLEDLPEGEMFLLNRRIFRKGRLLRKNFICTEVRSGLAYRINPAANILLYEEK